MRVNFKKTQNIVWEKEKSFIHKLIRDNVPQILFNMHLSFTSGENHPFKKCTGFFNDAIEITREQFWKMWIQIVLLMFSLLQLFL